MIHEQDTADQGCPLNEAKKGNSRVGSDQTEKKTITYCQDLMTERQVKQQRRHERLFNQHTLQLSSAVIQTMVPSE